jgi:Ca-activated chloride channel family protein
MSWAFPICFLALPLLVILAALRWWWGVRVRAVRAAVGAGVPHLTPWVARRRAVLRGVLLWCGLAVCALSLAGPRWGGADGLRQSSGCDVLVVLDCSRSMLANDLYPTRIEAARRKAIALAGLAPETRMALMPFAGVAALRCPLTGDHDAIAEMLKDCTPDLFPAPDFQGTAIGAAVQQGLGVLDRQTERGQAVLVISDGADDDKDAVQAAAKAAKAAGVPVYGLFVGDKERKVELELDGRKEVMDSDDTTLKELADTTGGLFLNASLDDSDVRAVHDHLTATVRQGTWEERRRIVASERYQWLLLPGLALVIIGLLVPLRRREKA